MHKSRTLALMTLPAVFLACMALAQDTAKPEPQLVFIVQEHVKPGMMGQYEEALGDIISMLEETEVSPEKVGFTTLSGFEMGYTFVIPLEDFGAMKTMREHWTAAREQVDESRWQDAERRANACVDHLSRFHAVHRPELSYQPARPHLAWDAITCVHYSFYYAQPGQEKALESVAQRFKEMYAKHGLPYSWNFYQSVTGDDLPLYVVAWPGASPAEIQTAKEKAGEALGEEAGALFAEALAASRRIEERTAFLRPELSYPRQKEE